MSHPVWVRGLKPKATLIYDGHIWSHPVWVRGLKPLMLSLAASALSRTLCGCVD